MKFKHFMRLDEIGEIEGANVDDIKLEPEPKGGGVRHIFYIGEYEYRVRLSQCPLTLNGRTISDRSVSIILSGPDSLSLTGFGNAHSVYTQMLKAIKKYLDVYQPEGLHFFGMEESMDLMYASFVKRFLGDRPGKDPRQVFFKITDFDYIRKDVFENLPIMQKLEVGACIAKWNRDQQKYINDIRNSKRQQRVPPKPTPTVAPQPTLTPPGPPDQPAQPTPTEGTSVFKDFMRLVEIGEIEKVDVQDIQFVSDGAEGRVKYVYQIDGREYRVRFAPYNYSDDQTGEPIAKSVNIVFSGPNGIGLTGLGNSHAVYTEMLKGIKKYLEVYQPGGLHFYGADGKMDLTYAAFVKRFLSDREGKDPRQVFIRVGSSDYLRKDIYEALAPDVKSRVDLKVGQWKEYESQYMKEREDQKMAQRRNFQKTAGMLGGFYVYSDREYGLIYKISAGSTSVDIIHFEGVELGSEPRVFFDYAYLYDMREEQMVRKNQLSRIGIEKLKIIIEALFNPRNRNSTMYVPGEILDYLKAVYNKTVDPRDNRINQLPKQTGTLPSVGGTNPPAAQSPMRGPGQPQRDLLDRYRQYSARDLARGEFDEV